MMFRLLRKHQTTRFAKRAMANGTSLVVCHWRLLLSARLHGALDLNVSGNGALVMLPL